MGAAFEGFCCACPDRLRDRYSGRMVFMNGWLQNYSYRTDLSWYIFSAAALGSLVITLLTVSYQASRQRLQIRCEV